MVDLPALGQQKPGVAAWAAWDREAGECVYFPFLSTSSYGPSPSSPNTPTNTIFSPDTERCKNQSEARKKERERAEGDGKVVPRGHKVRLTW